MLTLRRLALAATIVSFAAASVAARKPPAAAADPKKEGRAHFKTAEWLFAQRMYAEAIVEYQAAYRAWPADALFFNIAQCHRNLGHVDEAIDYFERYLKSGHAEASRVEVEELLAQLH